MPDRATLINQFLNESRWRDWDKVPLAGDASSRRYFRLTSGSKSAILMDAGPEDAEGTRAFVAMAELLRANGLTAPAILAEKTARGLLVLDDVGQNDFAHWLTQRPPDELALYTAAAEALLSIARIAPPTKLMRMTPAIGAEMISIIGPYYSRSGTSDLQHQMQRALAAHCPEPTTLALRDFHAENLIWRPRNEGHDRVGLLDFQDAFVAPAGYDLMSLLRDARRDVTPQTATAVIDYFLQHNDATRQSLSCLGVQRNLRILGVFARLATKAKKPKYLAFMPRVWGHIMYDLETPELAQLRQAVLDTVPAPSAQHLAGLVQ